MSKQKTHKDHGKKPPLEARKPAHDEDEIVHVPKGKSKLRFILILGLMIFTLVVFTVGSQLQSAFSSGNRANEVFMTWNRPGHGRQQLTGAEFLDHKRSLDDFFRVMGSRPPKELLSDANVAFTVITAQLARDAGVEVTRKDLREAIIKGEPGVSPQFGSAEAYRGALARVGVSTGQFEGALETQLLISRYQAMVTLATSQPTPESIEKAWKEQHQEYSFDGVSVAVEDFQDAAVAELPLDEELEAWYAAMPNQRAVFAEQWRPERVSAELVGFDPSDPNASATVLLERFPRPPEEDPEVFAKTYYDEVYFTRFLREEPLEEAPTGKDRLYLPYEEVADRARSEAPVRAALFDWLRDVRARTQAGEEVDLAAEAAELGLHHELVEEPTSQPDWALREPWGGARVGSQLLRSGPDGLVAAPVVEKQALMIGRVIERTPAGPPPIEDVRDKVVEEWLKEKQTELATAKLEELRESLRPAGESEEGDGTEDPAGADPIAELDGDPNVDQETFLAKVREAGLEPFQRDWFDPQLPAPLDADGEEDETPEEKFLREGYPRQEFYFAEEEGDVPPPVVGDDRVWLVRLAGKRDPETVDVTPAEYDGLKQRAAFDGFMFVRDEIMNPKVYVERYGLVLDGVDLLAEDEEESGAPGRGPGS